MVYPTARNLGLIWRLRVSSGREGSRTAGHTAPALPRTSGAGRVHFLARQLSNSAELQRANGSLPRQSKVLGARARRPDTSSPAVRDRPRGRSIGNGEVQHGRDLRRAASAGSKRASTGPALRLFVSGDHTSIASTSGSGCPLACRRCRQRASSHGVPVCAIVRRSGTSRRATAHTALTLRPPFRATIAS